MSLYIQVYSFGLSLVKNPVFFYCHSPCDHGAIFWGNVRRVVYGLSEQGLYDIIGTDNEEVLFLPCREVFERGRKPIEVIGPLLEDEARNVHEGFWN